jgi:hypothetical protein
MHLFEDILTKIIQEQEDELVAIDESVATMEEDLADAPPSAGHGPMDDPTEPHEKPCSVTEVVDDGVTSQLPTRR